MCAMMATGRTALKRFQLASVREQARSQSRSTLRDVQARSRRFGFRGPELAQLAPHFTDCTARNDHSCLFWAVAYLAATETGISVCDSFALGPAVIEN